MARQRGLSRTPRNKRSRRRKARPVEWVGGCVESPFFVKDRGEPYSPPMVIWLELPSGLIVGHRLIQPEERSGAVGRVLAEAIDNPLAGPARSPDRIRVSSRAAADEVKRLVGSTVPIDVAPTPELDEIVSEMADSLPPEDREEESYLDGGRLPGESVGELFAAAEHLYRVAPWNLTSDADILRLDIPDLGLKGACVSIIGELGQSFGFMMFPSLAAFEEFLDVAMETEGSETPPAFTTSWLSLSFERGADLSGTMRREVSAHGWPVAGAQAYPHMTFWEPGVGPGPVGERTLRVATATATAIARFFAKHGDIRELDDEEPLSESYPDVAGLAVRLTSPFEALPLLEARERGLDEVPPLIDQLQPRQVQTHKVGRNTPCPCGSRKKYKNCCMRDHEEERDSESRIASVHERDRHVLYGISRFAATEFGDEWLRAMDDVQYDEESLQLVAHWSVYHFLIEGRTAAEWYVERRAGRVSSSERRWVDAQREAWLSVWEVTDLERNVSVTLRDLLTEEVRVVREVNGSMTLELRDALLARVVDYEGRSFLCGCHIQPLPPLRAAEVVRRARSRLRRKRAVPVERLRDEGFGRYLIRRWEDAVDELYDEACELPTVFNTDGDPLLVTVDHYFIAAEADIAAGAHAEVGARIAGMEGVLPPEPDEGSPSYWFSRPGGPAASDTRNTLLGRAWLDSRGLHIESNSRERADSLRDRVEAACGDLIHHRAREHSDPVAQLPLTGGQDAHESPAPPEAQAIIREHKKRHYADWADRSLPAFEGKTPREAARTADGRREVDALLKQMENMEQQVPAGERFDFGGLRRELGLE